MEYTFLGRSGLRVSVIGLGLWQAGSRFWGSRSHDIIENIKSGILRGIELGINFFDTAEIYGGGFSERILGDTIGNRDDVVVATKIAGYRTTEHSIFKAVNASRRRLKRDVIDLIQYHWPPPIYVNICKIARILEKLAEKGIVAHIGVSNFSKPLLEKTLSCMHRYEIVSNQLQYSLAYRVVENKVKPYMDNHGIKLIAWSPLAKGALAGRLKPSSIVEKTDKVFYTAAKDFTLQKTLSEIARKYKATKAQIALAWLVAKGAIPIPGFRKLERVDENAGAAGIKLSESDLKKLDEASRRYLHVQDPCYNQLHSMRLIPGFIQELAIKLTGGI